MNCSCLFMVSLSTLLVTVIRNLKYSCSVVELPNIPEYLLPKSTYSYEIKH